jgi:hypothetical protein
MSKEIFSVGDNIRVPGDKYNNYTPGGPLKIIGTAKKGSIFNNEELQVDCFIIHNPNRNVNFVNGVDAMYSFEKIND